MNQQKRFGLDILLCLFTTPEEAQAKEQCETLKVSLQHHEIASKDIQGAVNSICNDKRTIFDCQDTALDYRRPGEEITSPGL